MDSFQRLMNIRANECSIYYTKTVAYAEIVYKTPYGFFFYFAKNERIFHDPNMCYMAIYNFL